jgi:hypothetical protein
MTEVDLIALVPGFPLWPQVACKVDAVQMTADVALAYSRTLAVATDACVGSQLDMWEAEPTVWFRWRFLDEQPIGQLTAPEVGGAGRPWYGQTSGSPRISAGCPSACAQDEQTDCRTAATGPAALAIA